MLYDVSHDARDVQRPRRRVGGARGRSRAAVAGAGDTAAAVAGVGRRWRMMQRRHVGDARIEHVPACVTMRHHEVMFWWHHICGGWWSRDYA